MNVKDLDPLKAQAQITELMASRGYSLNARDTNRRWFDFVCDDLSWPINASVTITDQGDVKLELSCTHGLFTISSGKFQINHTNFKHLFENPLKRIIGKLS